MTLSKARRAEIAAMPPIPCSCGCGELIPPFTKTGSPARFKHGHNDGGESTRFKAGDESYWKGKKNPHVAIHHAGKKLTPSEIRRRTNSRLIKNKGRYTSKESVKAGITKRGPEWLENVRKALAKRDLSGPKNPAWRGGIDRNGYVNFTRKLRTLIRERDGNRCQRCGKRWEDGKRKFPVHHLDHDKANYSPTNLVTTCHSCNVWYSYHRDYPAPRRLI